MKTVWTNGCFDVLHFGHFDFLRRCRELGDKLIVGLNSDESVRRLKGPTRPIHNLRQRLAQLAGIRYIDHTAVFDEDNPCQILSRIKPDIIVKGPGYNLDNMPEANIVKQYGGEIVILHGPDLSTTKILEKLAR